MLPVLPVLPVLPAFCVNTGLVGTSTSSAYMEDDQPTEVAVTLALCCTACADCLRASTRGVSAHMLLMIPSLCCLCCPRTSTSGVRPSAYFEDYVCLEAGGSVCVVRQYARHLGTGQVAQQQLVGYK